MAVETNHELILTVVKKVLSDMIEEKIVQAEGPTGIFETVDQAVENAVAAQKRLLVLPLHHRDKIIAAIRHAALDHNETISALAVKESGLGRYEDKLRENILCATKTPGTEDIEPRAYSGDDGLTLIEYAPRGVIGSLTPITNPTGTVINNAISMVAAGNAVVFNPHPTARETSIQTIRIIHEAIVRAGGPPGLVSSVPKPDLTTAKQLIEHPKINMLVATGGRPVVDVVLRSGKKAIGAGAGNPPALVDETANIRRAAASIIDGASINNNIFCTCEKEVIVVSAVADALISFMLETGKAYLLTPAQAEQVTKLIVTPERKINTAYIGKNVQVILKEIGINVGEEFRLAIFEAEKNHPLVWLEQMMPVMPIVRVRDVSEGIDFAVQVEQGNRHTAIMHSNHVEHMTAFARAVQTTIFVKNGPSYAGIGLGGEGHTSFTIAGPTGEGLTSARTFTRIRRCTLVDAFRII
ncbi:MAG: aldehyde dehydrogenase family protein [Pseudomonadota bacterium]|nr:aldehyde dehydrogenase EutE [Pseudomonadota bacterium]